MVEVTFRTQSRRSRPVPVRAGAAAFSWKTFFDVGDGAGDHQCVFRVYDEKGVAVLGEASLPLLEAVPPEGLLCTFSLRLGRVSTGRLTVHYELSRLHGAPPCRGNFLLSNAFGDVICASGADSLRPCQVLPNTKPFSSPAVKVAPRAFGAKIPDQMPKDLRLNSISLAALRAAASSAEANAGSPFAGTPPCYKCGSSSSSSSGGDSFRSALEEPVSVEDSELARAAAAAEQRRQREGAAEGYMAARMCNDVGLLRKLLAGDAVVEVPRPLGGVATHRGWENIEAYLRQNPARSDCFKDWAHASTEAESPDGASKAAVVRWVGSVYKFGCWHKVRSDFTIGADGLISRVSLATAG